MKLLRTATFPLLLAVIAVPVMLWSERSWSLVSGMADAWGIPRLRRPVMISIPTGHILGWLKRSALAQH
jgi:hypothetical protein